MAPLDECEGPPNFKDLADTSGYGLNVNGSVCLNNVCMCVSSASTPLSVPYLYRIRYANMTAGQSCVVENTGYIVYSGNTEYVDIVSRYVFA